MLKITFFHDQIFTRSFTFVLNLYSMYFLQVISLDRFIAVCSTRSESLAKLREPKKVRIIITLVWMLAFIACFPLYLLTDLKIQDKKCVL